MNIALIIAGGKGQRFNQSLPKQFHQVNDKPLIIYTLEKFDQHPLIDIIEIVCVKDYIDKLKDILKTYPLTKPYHITEGGNFGQASIYNGLIDLKRHNYSDDDIVIIHDAIRPNVSKEIITDNINTCLKYGNAITCVNCDTAVLEKTNDNYSLKEVNRDTLLLTQTPQSFYLSDIINAHNKAKELKIENTVASCTLYTSLNKKVYFSNGSKKNIKITTIEDLDLFKALLESENND